MISLEKSIRTCKVDPGWANRYESDRFLNPNQMSCPMWNGYDTYGRPVCADSFNAKTAGCYLPEDRIIVENNLRPRYMELVNLSAGGIKGEIYQDSYLQQDAAVQTRKLEEIYKVAGNPGIDYNGAIQSRCNYRSEGRYAETAQQDRARQNYFQGRATWDYKSAGGMQPQENFKCGSCNRR